MYKLYDFNLSGNCYKIRLLLHHLNIDYEKVQVDILNKGSRTPEFLAINPNGKTPVLVHNDTALVESNAILWYLAKDTAFLPKGHLEQSQILQWLFFEQANHAPNIATARYWITIIKAQEKYKKQLRMKKLMGNAALSIMEKHLSQNIYFVGKAYSIADIALYAYTHVAYEGGFDLTKYPCITKWLHNIKSQTNHIMLKD